MDVEAEGLSALLNMACGVKRAAFDGMHSAVVSACVDVNRKRKVRCMGVPSAFNATLCAVARILARVSDLLHCVRTSRDS
jgi:hypothetical protein